jgi:propionate CoA-transferase
MDFKPIINEPLLMDRRIFIDEPMNLISDLLNLDLRERVSYDADRNILFVNLEGWSARSKRDIDDLHKIMVDVCATLGRRVNAVFNHEGFRISEPLLDDYADMIQQMMEHYFAKTTRYATSAFLRLKMKEALSKRGIAPHIFERKEDADAFLEVVG